MRTKDKGMRAKQTREREKESARDKGTKGQRAKPTLERKGQKTKRREHGRWNKATKNIPNWELKTKPTRSQHNERRAQEPSLNELALSYVST